MEDHSWDASDGQKVGIRNSQAREGVVISLEERIIKRQNNEVK